MTAIKEKKIFSVGLVALMMSGTGYAAVPAADITLQPVVTDNLPIHFSLSGWSCSEWGVSSKNEKPLYYPYEDTTDDWWDNLLQEQLQARMPVLMLHSRRPADEASGNMNPKDLHRAVSALNRNGISPSLMKIANFIDTAAWQLAYDRLYGTGQGIYYSGGGTAFDLSNQAAWDAIVWAGLIKPWFDEIPSSYWYRVSGRPVINIWALNPASGYTNHQGNLSAMTTWLANKFQTQYGVRPWFVHNTSNLSFWGDSTLPNNADVLGFDPWFGPSDAGYSTYTHNGFTHSTIVPAYQENNDPNYTPGHVTVPRRNGDTLLAGFNEAWNQKANQVLIEGWTNYEEGMALYRSENAKWVFPNQFINMAREFNDRRTVTLKLEAEGADSYYDTTPGNDGGKFRRSGDLDIQDVDGGVGWNVGWTAVGEWLEYKDVFFSAGNYTFPIRYACHFNQTIRLNVDGVSLGNVTLPATGGWQNWDTIYLGTQTLSHGKHTLRIEFVSGDTNLDWLFIKKTDKIASLKSVANNQYVCAERGGRDVVNANQTASGPWEEFTICDLNGGNLESGDSVNVQVHNGLYLSAEGGDGSTLSANGTATGVGEQFTIQKVGAAIGELISTGNQVALQSLNGRYIHVNTATKAVDCTGSAIGNSEKFTLEVTESGYGNWAATFSGIDLSDPVADFDNDGLDNLLEYALGGNPVSNDAAAVLPFFQTLENYFVLVHNERTDDTNLTYTVERTTNLVSNSWNTNGVEFAGEAAFSNVWKTVTNQIPTLGKEQQFIRLKVEKD